ncbi:TrkA C-terminal domain-containing protein [Leptotrichia sp. oral taxon 498]|uniref:TrkA C-terminal domain-containing protein n=1 Tax=Leptotrichia sp. oral taxon 498 TaxID=712368 RepID=UPI001F29FBAD|nr:TrkA C-terminal domain-containing protein [Leptotrichia sp. oral taxon 498]
MLENWWKDRHSKNKKNNEDKIVTLLIPVGVNSEFDGKLVKELKLPENILIISVRSEGEDHIAKGNTKIQSGNQIVMITDYKTASKYASELKERGLKII